MMSTASQAVMNNHGGLFEEQDHEMLPNLGFSIINNSSVSADHMVAMPMVSSSSCHQESLIMFKGFNNNNNNVINANMMMPPPPPNNTSNLTQALLVAASASSQQIIKPPPSQHLHNNIINLTAAASSSSPPNSNNSSTLPPPPTHLLSLHTSALLLNPWGGWGDEVSDQCLNSGNKRSSSSNNGGIGEIGVYGMKMRKIKGRRKMREPRFCFKTMSDVDVLDDGYKWRKYGQKVVKNTHHPRSYYRCTQDNCRVKKRVERLAEDPRMVITTYEGRHVHSPSNDLEDSQPSDSQLTNFLW